MNRYARQMMVPGVGQSGQDRLAAAHVLVVGAGGLGCPALQYLAGAGVGRITVIDPDHVEEGNLHRQPLYRMADLGRAKAQAARDHLRAAHPDVKVVTFTAALHPAITDGMVEPGDIVIDAADNFAVSYILSDACLRLRKPLISASVLGQTGYVGAYCATAPSLRAVFPDPPDTAATCASAGVMGPTVGMIGALQAQLCLQILLRHQPSPLGRLVTLDLQELRFGGFDFRGAKEPDFAAPFLSARDIKTTDHVIDLRHPSETPPLPISHVQHGTEDRALDADHRVVLCCTTGLRAWRTAARLRSKGHQNLALLATRACE